jgi:hypothetical protein
MTQLFGVMPFIRNPLLGKHILPGLPDGCETLIRTFIYYYRLLVSPLVRFALNSMVRNLQA